MKIRRKSLINSLLILSSLASSMTILADTDVIETSKPVVEQLVNTLSKLAGEPHPGYRKNHAKGIVTLGTFVPSPEAKTVSSAIHLQSEPTNVTVRFSNATGLPTISDTDPNAFPKGIAIRFDLGDEGYTDIVNISVNGFPAATPEDFLGLLNAIAASGPEVEQPSPIVQYLDSHPAAKRFVEIPKPAPISFATQSFYGVNAFKFTNSNGDEHYGRYIMTPVSGEAFLNDDQRKTASANYLMDELPTRLENAAFQYHLSVQIAAEDDEVNDATLAWPSSRQVVDLGTLTVNQIDPDGEAFAKANMYNPLALTAGIEPSDDPILMARPGAYAVSFGRRVSGQ